jgi:hypothetical protein
VLAGVVLAFGEFAVTPTQILWVNMITGVTLALALSFEPSEPGHHVPPSAGSRCSHSCRASWSGASGTCRSSCRRRLHGPLPVAARERRGCGVRPHRRRERPRRGPALVPLHLPVQWKASVGWSALVGNRVALVAAGLLLLFQAAFTYLPVANAIFDTRPLALGTWVPVLSVGLVLYVAVELEKAAGRSGGRGSAHPRNI